MSGKHEEKEGGLEKGVDGGRVPRKLTPEEVRRRYEEGREKTGDLRRVLRRQMEGSMYPPGVYEKGGQAWAMNIVPGPDIPLGPSWKYIVLR